MAISDEQLREAVDAVFSQFDADGSNTLDKNEVFNLICAAMDKMDPKPDRQPTHEEVDALVAHCDTSGDGKISKMELYTVFSKAING